MNTLNDVKQFHQLFDHPVLETPTIPDISRSNLRVNLLVEEVKELGEAILKGNIIEAADAFADIQYVLSGAILEFGLADKFPAIFAEVQRSNMSKACKTIEEAELTVIYHEEKQGECSYYSKTIHDDNGIPSTVYLVYRKSDLKTMKSINYSPANLSLILNS